MTHVSLPLIRNVRSVPASPLDVGKGILAWISLDIGPLRIDGVALRVRRSDGSPYLQFPKRLASNGKKHPIIRPLGQAALDAIEAEVFEALRQGERQ